MKEIPPSRKRICSNCQTFVDSVSPETFRLVEGWSRWRTRHNNVAFVRDLDTYLCHTCQDEWANTGFNESQSRLFYVGNDGALEPPAKGECQDCGIPVACVSLETYLLLRGWLRTKQKPTNRHSHDSSQNNLHHVVVIGRYLCRECFKRKKAGIPVGQMTLWE